MHAQRSHYLVAWLLTTVVCELEAQQPQKQTILLGPKAADHRCTPAFFLISPEVVVEPSGHVRLAKSTLLTDEAGATDQQQAEVLGAHVLAKKVFLLPDAPVAEAQLLFFGHAANVRVNGAALDKVERLPSTGWKTARIPGKLLKPGENDIVFSGKGSLLVEPGRRGNSFKSMDGGKTWSNQHLTTRGDVDGEYLVRLRVPLHPREGWAMTQALDLWGGTSEQAARPQMTHSFRAPDFKDQPKGTSIACFLRTGSTPQPEEKTWTGWVPLVTEHRHEEWARAHRWAQWKFVLRTERADATPVLPPEFPLEFQAEATEPVNANDLKIANYSRVSRGSVPFVYQPPSKKLDHLRKHYKLDDVIAPGKTEMEQLMLLRYWVRNQWHTGWKGSQASWMPPWDALIILECKDQPECMTMCTHYAAVFTQCCQALGWNARHCILDHHCVSEVYVREHSQWVMMDTGNSGKRADVGLHFEAPLMTLSGPVSQPMSARSIHRALVSGDTKALRVCFTPRALSDKIVHLCRPAPEGKNDPKRPDTIPAAELTNFPVCQIENFRRFGFPARNTFLTTLLPGELYQGFSPYFYDGYWWVGDDRDQPTVSPEYSKLLDPRRYQDIDWPLDGTAFHLSRTAKSGELRVDLESFMPNLKLHELRTASGAWQTTPASFTWQLAPGDNELLVRGVNHWGKAGAAGRAMVAWKAK